MVEPQGLKSLGYVLLAAAHVREIILFQHRGQALLTQGSERTLNVHQALFVNDYKSFPFCVIETSLSGFASFPSSV